MDENKKVMTPEKFENEKIMTPEEFEDRMRKIQELYINKHDDQELAHVNADGIMCQLLSRLGYKKGIDIFYRMPKWYA